MVAALRFELSKVTVPAIRVRAVSSLMNVSTEFAAAVAKGLGMELPEAMPMALQTPTEPEVEQSPALSLKALPGEVGIRTRKIAILIADGVEGESIAILQSALLDAGAVPRLIGPTSGTYTDASGATLEADASMGNEPGFLFDALVLPDGEDGVNALSNVGYTMEFVKDQYRHCKTILVLGASASLLDEAGIATTLPSGEEDSGILIAEASAANDIAASFIAAMAQYRHTARDTDPPLI